MDESGSGCTERADGEGVPNSSGGVSDSPELLQNPRPPICSQCGSSCGEGDSSSEGPERKGIKRPKIYLQGEKSFQCGACVVASVLDYFGVEPDHINTLYQQLRGEYKHSGDHDNGLFQASLQSWFLRRDWVCIDSNLQGPYEYKEDGKDYYAADNTFKNQRVATWRCIKRMLLDGYLCLLAFNTNYNTGHYAIVYDAFVKKSLHWLRIACSQQGYMEVQALDFLKPGTVQDFLFVKPDNLELR